MAADRSNPLTLVRFCSAALFLATAFGTTNCGGSASRHLISLDVTPKDVEAVAPTGTAQFSAEGTFDRNPTTETNLTVQWTSSDSSVVTITTAGVATCIAVGGPVTITGSEAGAMGTISDTALLTCLNSNPSPGIGKCVVAKDNTLSGYCIGVRGGICREAYDPTNCPPQSPASGPGADQCAQSSFTVDGVRSCTP
jgi:hypothetical protein